MTTLYLDHSCKRCDFSAHDVLDVDGRMVKLSCVYCGLIDKIKTAKPLEMQPERERGFTFKTGRFVGMTLAEADAQPNGRKYLKWMSENSSDGATIKAYLDSSQPKNCT